MIVPADDLSGAAECAGVAWRFGEAVGLLREPLRRPHDGTVVIDTDSRLLGPRLAGRAVRDCLPPWPVDASGLFKKTDSVLRGQVRAELVAMAQSLRFRRILLVPANPALGRTLEAGQMLVNGVPLHRTEFAHDPHHQAATADPVRLLGTTRGYPTHCVALGDPLPRTGILVGGVSCEGDLETWAGIAAEHGIACAGSAAFLGAVLRSQGRREPPVAQAPVADVSGTLIVSGSASAASRSNIGRAERNGVAVVRMGASEAARGMVGPAVEAAAGLLRAVPVTILCVDGPVLAGGAAADRISGTLAAIAGRLVDQGAVARLLLEGGATASRVLGALGIRRFEVIRECAPGVVLLACPERPGLEVATKPGSYPWSAPFPGACADNGVR